MEKNNKSTGVWDIVLLGLALILFNGLLTFLKPCGPKDDGGWMTCHWAGRALTGVSGTMLALAILRLFVRGGVKLGLDIGTAALAVLSICIPGHLIGLCMMDAMRCRAVMMPGITVIAILAAAAAVIDIFVQRKRNGT